MQSACAVLHCHLWPVWFHTVFPHYLINGKIFGKKLLNVKCAFWLSLQLLSETFLILWKIQRDIITNVHSLHVTCPLFLLYFNETRIFSTQFREKSWNIKFHHNPSNRSRDVPCGQMDRHDKAKRTFSKILRARLKKWPLSHSGCFAVRKKTPRYS